MTQNIFITVNHGTLEYTAAPHLGVRHAFTTRLGGVDVGSRRGLNLGYSRTDRPDAVEENYRILCRALGLDENRLAWSSQVHGNKVRRIQDGDFCRLGVPAPEGDGLVTDVPGVGLVVYTADCVPLLLSDPVRGVVAALHCGWRGTVADMAGEGVRAMVKMYGCRPEDIRAAVGPGISQCCFKVLGRQGEEFISTRPVAPYKGEALFPQETIPGKFYVDNKGVNRALLIRAGLDPKNIAVSDECTRCDTDRYWSHRFHGGSRGSEGAIIAANDR